MRNFMRIGMAHLGLFLTIQAQAQFTTSSSNLYHTGGSVGIGITNPGRLLHLNSGSNVYLRVSKSQFSNNLDFGITSHYADLSYTAGTSTNSNFRFLTNGNTRMYIQHDGKVGIGTITPTLAALHVAAASSSVQLRLERTGTSTGVSADIGGFGGNLFFYPGGWGNTIGNVIFDTSGKVGIGNSSPDNKLHVEGDMLLDVYNNSGHEKGIFFREGFSTTNKYNLSIMAYDHNGSGSSPDGLSLNGYDGVSFSTGSNSRSERMRIASDGNVGIGTTAPGSFKNSNQASWPSYTNSDRILTTYSANAQSVMELASANTSSSRIGSIYFTNMNGQSDAHRQISGIWSERDANYTAHTHLQGGKLYFMTKVSGSGTQNLIVMDNAGKLGIGTTSPGEKLEVTGNALIDGEIYSKKVKVSSDPGNWPDYVFESDYTLRPLSEVEAFIKANRHLPEVPSAKEVEKDGLDLGSMDATLLKKMEEMTLYMIEMKKENEALKKNMRAMQKELNELKSKGK